MFTDFIDRTGDYNKRARKIEKAQEIRGKRKNRTRIESPMSEISDEEVDYGSSASNANSDIAPDSSWTPLFKKNDD